MAIEKASLGVFDTTNKILFATLSSGISAEIKEIQLLQDSERKLKKTITVEEGRFKKSKLKDVKKKLSFKLAHLRKDLQDDRNSIKRKRAIIEHSHKSIAALKKQIQDKTSAKSTLDGVLETALSRLLKEKEGQVVAHNLRLSQLKKRSAQLSSDRRIILKQVEKSEAEIEQEVATVKRKKLAELSRKEKIFAKQEAVKRRTLKEEEAKLHDLTKNLHAFTREKKRLLGIQKKADASSALLAEQISNLNALAKDLASNKSRRLVVLAKEKQDRKVIASTNKDKTRIKTQIQGEINKFLEIYKRQLNVLLSSRDKVNKHIRELEQCRGGAVQALEDDSTTLHKLQNSMDDLDRSLQQHRKLDQARISLILGDISSRQQELASGKAKLKKVEALVREVSGIAGGMPEAIGGFKKEKARVSSSIVELKKDILDKRKQIGDLEIKLAQVEQDIASKKSQFQHQMRDRKSLRKNHQRQLSDVESSLTKVRGELIKVQNNITTLNAQEQATMIRKNRVLGQKLKGVLETLSSQRTVYQKDVKKDKELEANILDINRQMGGLTSKLKSSGKKLSVFTKALADAHHDRKVLVNKERTLFGIMRILKKEKSLYSANYSSKLLAYLDSLQAGAQRIALWELANVQKEIDAWGARRSATSSSAASLKRKFASKVETDKSFLAKLEKKSLREVAQLRKQSLRKLHHSGAFEISLVEKRMDDVARAIKIQKAKLNTATAKIDRETEQEKLLIHQEKERLTRNISSLIRGRVREGKKIVASEKYIQDKKSALVVSDATYARWEQRRDELAKRLGEYNKDVSRLKSIVQEKAKRTSEKDKLKKELKHLHMVLENKLPRSRTKTKIVTKIKKVPVRDTKTVKPALKTIDVLLGKLPKTEIDKFAKSKDFNSYKKLMGRYGVK